MRSILLAVVLCTVGFCAFPRAGFSLPSGPEELVFRLARAVKEKDVQAFTDFRVFL